MNKYLVFELTESPAPGIAVVDGGSTMRAYLEYMSAGQPISTHKTLQEARAVAETIAAFKNLPIRSWSL